jgi:hypothetical protein
MEPEGSLPSSQELSNILHIDFPILDMDVELASVVTAVSKNKSIKHLNMGRNLNNMKAKHIASVMDAVVQMIQVSNIRHHLFRC